MGSTPLLLSGYYTQECLFDCHLDDTSMHSKESKLQTSQPTLDKRANHAVSFRAGSCGSFEFDLHSLRPHHGSSSAHLSTNRVLHFTIALQRILKSILPCDEP